MYESVLTYVSLPDKNRLNKRPSVRSETNVAAHPHRLHLNNDKVTLNHS